MEKFKQLSLKEKTEYIVCCMLYPFTMPFHKQAKPVKRMGKIKRRMGAGILAAVMVCTMLPGTVFALETNGMTECHSAHDESCGYIAAVEGAPCSHLKEDGSYSCAPADADEEYVCPHDDECGYVETVDSVSCIHKCDICQPKDSSEPDQKCICDPVIEDESEHMSTDCPFYVEKAPECVCTVKCTPADEENEIEASINGECPVCGTEGEDLSLCKGEAAAPFAVERVVSKRTACLDLRSTIIDKDGNPLVSTDGVYDMLTEEGWKWDENTSTLTLNEVNLDVSGNCGILLDKDASIELIGNNSVVTDDSIAIQNFGNLIISGTGSIEISGKWAGINVDDQLSGTGYNINIAGGNVNVISTNDTAILADGSISISGGNITATGYYCGLQAAGGITISGATVTAKSSNDSAIFTKGALSITDSADVTATDTLYSGVNAKDNITITDSTVEAGGGTDSSTGDGYTAIYTPQTLTIDGTSDVTADGDWRGMDAETALSIGGSAKVTATGTNAGLQSKDVSISGNSLVEATSTDASAIAGSDSISITENADVMATGAQADIASNGSMNLSAKNIEATGGWYGIDNDGDNASGITIGGKLTALATGGHGIYGTQSITGDDKADITATGTMNGIQVAGNIAFIGSKVEAIGNGGCGISSKGKITIDSGVVHAKGASTYAAIRTENIQTGSEAAESKISLTNLIEKNGGKVAFCDWASNDGNMTSWTTFIAKDDDELTTTSEGGFTNGLLEVWLAAPHTVTFDVNGGSGTSSTVKVYPGNNVTAPATDPAKDGCHFSGWYLDDTKFNFANTAITGNISLKAKLDTHTPGADDGDCTTAIKCSVCGLEATPAKTHTISDWQSNATNHWKKCANVDCTHTELSTVHTFGEWVIDNEATETTAGSKHRVCDICKYKETVTIPVAPHIHTPSSEWSSDATNHWHNCVANDGTKLDSAAHNFGEWVIDKEATEKEVGSKHRNCSACTYAETVEIPTAPHSHNPVTEWSSDTANHWHNCVANDGERMNTAAHTPGEAATTEHPQACTICGYEIAPKLPSNSTLVDATTGTRAEYEDGSVFDADIVLSVTSKPQAEMDKFKDSVNKAAPGLTLGGLYDVKLLKDGVSIQPDGKVKVSIPLTDAMKAMTDLKVVYIDDNGNVAIIPSEVKNGMITFITDHFSDYGVIGKVKVTDSGNNTGSGNNNDNTHSPQTGDNSPMLLFVLMMCASGTVLVALSKKKKVFRHLKK